MLDLVNKSMPATIEVSGADFISLSEKRLISPDKDFQVIEVFPSPELREGEHRIVLSWDTYTDLDIKALQMDK